MTNRLIALAFALATASLAALGRWLVGRVSGAPEAVDLIASLVDSALYLLSTTATVGGTTIALMLTVVGVARRADHDFSDSLYREITLVASLSATGLGLSLILLLAMSVPYSGFEGATPALYEWLYEILFGGVALVVVLAVGTVTLLALTVRQLIAAVAPHGHRRRTGPVNSS